MSLSPTGSTPPRSAVADSPSPARGGRIAPSSPGQGEATRAEREREGVEPLKEVGASFEAIFLRMIVASMRSASGNSELFPDSGGIGELRDAAVADVLARCGSLGIGTTIA